MNTLPIAPDSEFPRLNFLEYPFDEREAYEANARGRRSHVCVEFENGDRFPVYFYDPVALRQELEGMEMMESTSMAPHVAEPGMIVIPEITEHYMKNAVATLIKVHYFDHMRPLQKP